MLPIIITLAFGTQRPPDRARCGRQPRSAVSTIARSGCFRYRKTHTKEQRPLKLQLYSELELSGKVKPSTHLPLTSGNQRPSTSRPLDSRPTRFMAHDAPPIDATCALTHPKAGRPTRFMAHDPPPIDATCALTHPKAGRPTQRPGRPHKGPSSRLDPWFPRRPLARHAGPRPTKKAEATTGKFFNADSLSPSLTLGSSSSSRSRGVDLGSPSTQRPLPS